MPSSTIRIDTEVRSELQRRARPLEDTPNSVLRRLLGLPKPAPRIEPRVANLLNLVQDLVGQVVQWQRDERGYTVVARNEKLIAHIRTHKERLTIAVRKGDAKKAGLNNWANERQDRYFSCTSVRWYVPDGDDPAYKRVAELLERLHELNSTT